MKSEIEPIKQDTPNTGQGRDEAFKDGFNISHMEAMVHDCGEQPTGWRERSDIAHAYVDGKQLTELQQSTLIAEGMKDVRPINLVGRVVRGVLGQEAKSRTDVKIEADTDEAAEVCDVFNGKLQEAKRETYSDMAVSQGYMGQVIGGAGWVEVGRSSDPLAYPYRVEDVPRDEMWWDWRDRDMLLRRARWQARIRWSDLDEVEMLMPDKKDLLRNVSTGWTRFFDGGGPIDDTDVRDGFEVEKRWSNYRRRSEWYDSSRKRVKLYEIWYRTPAMAIVLHWSPTKRVLFDRNSPLHIQAIASNKVKVTKSPTMQVRMSLYAGPHRMLDIGTRRRLFPFVPFFAYRDDEDGSPYGLVEGMIAPQDEYNARRLRINWLLRARQILVDNDALDETVNTLEEIADTVMRPDFTAVLNGKRKNANGFQVLQGLSLQKEQVDVMQDAKQLIQDVPGVYGSQLGQQSSGVTSGIANSLLIEQGAVAMADLNDNYRHSRRMVFELLLDEIIQDHTDRDLQMTIGTGSSRRVVVLNTFDQQGNVINDVRDASMRVGLGDVPATPAYKMQQQQNIATIIGALGAASPQAVAVLAPSFIENTDLPDRKERADDLRRMTGIPTAQDKKAAEEQQAKQAEQQAQQQQIEQKGIQLALDEQQAKVRKLHTAADLDEAKAAELGHGMRMGEMEHELDASAQAQQAQAAQQPDPEAERQRLIEESIAEAMPA